MMGTSTEKNRVRTYSVVLIILFFTGLLIPVAPAGRGLPKENAPFQLEEQYRRESDPKQRVLIATKLAEVRLKELQAAYKKEIIPTSQNETVENYLGAIERLGKAVNDASDVGYSKRAEQRLRRQLRELEDLKMAVSYQERPVVAKVEEQVAAVLEKILYSIMQPRQEEAKR